jgi:hypothetical protein
MARFDFGICMAAFNGKNTLRTAKFNQDAEGKTFTLYRADNKSQFAYSMSRFEKISALKVEGGKLTKPQAEAQKAMQLASAKVATVFGLDAALHQLEAWQLLKGWSSTSQLMNSHQPVAPAEAQLSLFNTQTDIPDKET